MKIVALALAIGLSATGCTSATTPFVVGAVYPTGGGQGPGGIEEYRGVQLAAELSNKTTRRPVELKLEQSDSADAAPGAVRRLSASGARVIVGSYGSTISRPAAGVASKLGDVFWETGAVGDLSQGARGGRNVFRVPVTGVVLGRAAINYIDGQLAPKLARPAALKYAVAYVDDVYGRSVGRGALDQIKESGLPLVADIPYDIQHFDADAIAMRVKDSGADVLMVSAYLEDGISLREAMLAHEVPLAVNIGTSSSYCMIEFGKRLGDKALGLFASDKPDGDAVDAAALTPDAAQALKWARTEYKKRFNAGMTAPALAGFAGGWALFHHVLPKAPSGAPADVARAALSVKIKSGGLPNGAGLDFAAPGSPDAGANLLASSVIWQWVKPETRAVVWPAAVAQQQAVLPL